MKIKFKKLHKDAVLPTYAKPGDAAMDLTSVSLERPDEHPYVEHGTGLAVEIPEGYVGLIYPRSSISKTPFRLANSVGVIDSGYRGEIKLRFQADGHVVDAMLQNKLKTHAYKVGDRVGQLMIIPIPTIETEWAEELTETERADGGFGSTGE